MFSFPLNSTIYPFQPIFIQYLACYSGIAANIKHEKPSEVNDDGKRINTRVSVCVQRNPLNGCNPITLKWNGAVPLRGGVCSAVQLKRCNLRDALIGGIE